jgi:hypothetical protein
MCAPFPIIEGVAETGHPNLEAIIGKALKAFQLQMKIKLAQMAKANDENDAW